MSYSLGSRRRAIWLCAGLLWALPTAHAEESPPAKAPEETPQDAPGTATEAPPTAPVETAASSPGGPSSKAPKEDADLDARVDALMDRMVRARTRIAALGEALFETRVEVHVDNRVEDHRLLHVRLLLDGVPVHDSDGAGLSQDERVRLFSGYAAPGLHALEVEVEQAHEQDDRYQYLLAQRFRFRVPEGKVTELHLRLDDDSDIAEEFEEDQDGEYDVRTRLRVMTRELGEG